jgi:BirA family transcriptional regulator, biotin operon repressor / biotin---[acetyl-CoA-carboxylase] ligase
MLIGRLAGLGGLAVSATLQRGYGIDAQIKWPNDVLVGGRKLCGVLAEAAWMGAEMNAVILGIGVNVTPQAVPPLEDQAFPATSVEQALGQPVDRAQLLHDILKNLLYWRRRLDTTDFWRAWNANLAFKGEWVTLQPGLPPESGQAEPPMRGRLLGLDRLGNLRVQDEQGQEFTFTTGELHLRPAS